MNVGHPISDEVLDYAQIALSEGEHWLAYNQTLYFIEKEDVHFFNSQKEANEFAKNNFSDRDSFNVIHFNSIKDILERIPYGGPGKTELIQDPDINGLFNKEGNEFTDALIEHFEQQQSSLFNSQLKTNIMNKENLQYLTDNLKYMGFGDTLKADLEKNLGEGKGEFQLHFNSEFGKKKFDAALNFKKSDSTDMYFFNSYQASLERNNGEKVQQQFYLNKGKGVTAKEAFNLLDGRAVHKDLVTKEGQEYKAWVQLDLTNKTDRGYEVKQFHENYGFDLKDAVGKFAIAELHAPEKEDALMQSLKKGNVQSVTIEVNGESHKMFIEANPQFKKVDLFDSNMKLVAKESIEKYQGVAEVASKAAKEELGTDKKKDLKQEPKPGLEKKNSKSLLPKKRESQKKGLGVS